MTPSLRAAGSGRMVLLSDTSAGLQVCLKPEISCTISVRNKTNNWTFSSRFLTGNPDNYYGEDCLSILINSGYWNDDNCSNKRGYICKKKGEYVALIVANRGQKSVFVTLNSCFLFQETHLSLLHLMTVTIPHHLHSDCLQITPK